MKKMLWLLLAAVPFQASASAEDPIAWKCYMCTPAEREAVALGKGVGEHFVYNAAATRTLYGYRVTLQQGTLAAEEFAPPAWIARQYEEMMKLYKADDAEFRDEWGTIGIEPPVPGEARLWGHHTSGLHPQSAEARERAMRVIRNAVRFNFLRYDGAHGRVLRFEPQLHGQAPLISRLNITTSQHGHIEHVFDHDTKQWVYLEARDLHNVMQDSAEDFLAPDGGPRRFYYSYGYPELQRAFIQRAEWAGVKVFGELPSRQNVYFNCSRRGDEIHCQIN